MFIQNPPVNEMQSFTNSQFQEIINGKKIHDANIESYRKNNDMLIRGNIDDKPIYYDSRQNRPTSFRNKKVSFSNLNSSNRRRPPIIRDLTPFHLMIRPSRRNKKTNNRKYKKKSKKVKNQKNKTQKKNQKRKKE
jgi:hypothetical protein